MVPGRRRALSAGQTDRGYTFVEIVIVTAIVAILASAILPLARVTMQRQREIELRRDLREMRTAIDKFKDAFDQGKIAQSDLPDNSEGYPPTLDTLVNGVKAAPQGAAPGSVGGAQPRAGGAAGASGSSSSSEGAMLRFLRRVPIDPMTKTSTWGMRSSRDRPDSKSWGGQDVYDVYTTSEGRALDGTKYSDW